MVFDRQSLVFQAGLAKIKDKETADFLDELMSGIDQKYWIGLTGNASSWVWNDGDDLTFDRWQTSTEPSGDGPCVVAIYSWSFKWNDIYCHYESYFICEV